MGIDAAIFGELVRMAGMARPKGRAIMLGRQNYFYPEWQPKRRFAYRPPRDRFQEALISQGSSLKAADLGQSDGFSEKLFETLGYGKVESMDISDFEGASVVWDLGLPVPAELCGQFSFVFDGGTIEHVFEAPQAFRNVYSMLSDGGIFAASSPINGWPGHGFYQFGPELVWSFWNRVMGCKVHACRLMSTDGNFRMEVADPALSGKRSEWTEDLKDGHFHSKALYLWYVVEKSGTSKLQGRAVQSDYAADWENAGTRISGGVN